MIRSNLSQARLLESVRPPVAAPQPNAFFWRSQASQILTKNPSFLASVTHARFSEVLGHRHGGEYSRAGVS